MTVGSRDSFLAKKGQRVSRAAPLQFQGLQPPLSLNPLHPCPAQKEATSSSRQNEPKGRENMSRLLGNIQLCPPTSAQPMASLRGVPQPKTHNPQVRCLSQSHLARVLPPLLIKRRHA